MRRASPRKTHARFWRSSVSAPITSGARSRRSHPVNERAPSSLCSQRAVSTASSSTSRRTISMCRRSKNSRRRSARLPARSCSSRTTGVFSPPFALLGRWSCHPAPPGPHKRAVADEPLEEFGVEPPPPCEPARHLSLRRDDGRSYGRCNQPVEAALRGGGLGEDLIPARVLESLDHSVLVGLNRARDDRATELERVQDRFQFLGFEAELRLEILARGRTRGGEVIEHASPVWLCAHPRDLGSADRIDCPRRTAPRGRPRRGSGARNRASASAAPDRGGSPRPPRLSQGLGPV